MVACKIDHNADGSVPLALCRMCRPARYLAVPIAPAAERTDAQVAEHQERMDRRQRRKLRAERKRLMDEVALIAGRNPKATKKLEAALDLINRDLFLVS